MRKPTINDVAAAAGVSRATASRALSDYGRISEQTRTEVKKAAERIGYTPNQVARSMRAGNTKTLGLVIIADFTNVFFDRATKGIVDTARANGYEVLISNTDENLDVEREAIQTLIEKQVDGLIVVPSTAAVHDHLDPKARQNKPLVIIDRMVPGINATSITTNDFASCEMAVKEAKDKGHTNMAFLIATSTVQEAQTEKPILQNTTIEDRVNGFMNGIVDNNVKDPIWIYAPDDPEKTQRAVEELLNPKTKENKKQKPPTVIFTSNNDMALAVLKTANKLKLNIPKDISLVTVDDSEWLEAIAPGITVVERPVDELAKLAVEKLIEHINNNSKKPEKIVLETKLISRGSIQNRKAK
jgi:LacI family transcriptional regulator